MRRHAGAHRHHLEDGGREHEAAAECHEIVQERCIPASTQRDDDAAQRGGSRSHAQ